jgi:thioredoxin reductase
VLFEIPVAAASWASVTPRRARIRLKRGPTSASTAAIAGELSIRRGNQLFPEMATNLAESSRYTQPVRMNENNFDVVVVGGGAAGLSAALVLGRARRRVAVVDAGMPRNAPATHMQGFLSRDGMAPADFLAAGRIEVAGYGVEMIGEQVAEIEPGFAVRLAGGGVLNARRVLVATGARDELPDIPGVRERWGRDLLHCPYCHGWEVRDQPVGVLGNVPGSVQHAQLVRQWSDDVVFFAHTYELTASEDAELQARGVQVFREEVARLVVEDDRLVGVELLDGRVIARTAVFIRPSNVPQVDGLLARLGCERDAAGFVAVDGDGRTSNPGVWAAGNVVDPRAQVITSAGGGSAAAIAINADLVRDDVDRAVSASPPPESARHGQQSRERKDYT